VTVRGIPELRTRLSRLTPNRDLMRNLGRSIGLGSVTPTVVNTVASASYAVFVEFGTRAHDIVPRVKKALRFAIGGNARLSGTPRTGGPVQFAKRVRHPGSKPRPFMVPGAQKAVGGLGLKDTIVRLWNGRG